MISYFQQHISKQNNTSSYINT